MPPYRLANLDPDQLMQIEQLENELGLTLIAWEPDGGANQTVTEEANNFPTDAILDTYETYDPFPW
ncbi:MAG: hypothetical protein ACM3XM_12980 [Mycobacterium leprae]